MARLLHRPDERQNRLPEPQKRHSMQVYRRTHRNKMGPTVSKLQATAFI